jgi:hypothetical protein
MKIMCAILFATNPDPRPDSPFLDRVTFAYFVEGCGAIGIIQADRIVQASLVEFGVPHTPWPMAYDPSMRKAAAAGTHKSLQAGACDFFKEHPKAVTALRRAADELGVHVLG